jgi:RNA-directed DNA polymerase
MGLFAFLRRLFGGKTPRPVWRHSGPELPVAELARRLGMKEDELRRIEPAYREFFIPKRSGEPRRILAPQPPLQAVQRCILHRLLGRLKSHPAAHGFERGRSIVTNALPHAGRAVVLRFDIRDFFASTTDIRLRAFFFAHGWDAEAADLLTRICTFEGGLPQGATTSPRLSNLVNYRLDARLAALAAAPARFRNVRTGSAILKNTAPDSVRYTRYADDLTFSLAEDDAVHVKRLLWLVRYIVADEGYELHHKKKLHIQRRHDRQIVTGLVVNDTVNLPRARRRWLRAVEHRLQTGQQATLTPEQLAGWRAFAAMVTPPRTV